MNKENDWFLAISENPTFDLSEFSQVGLTSDNTQLREKSYYENNKYIQSLYQTDGKFDRAKFDQAYNAAAQSYQSLSNQDVLSNILQDYEYDMYDSTRPVGAKIKKPDIEFKKVANPLKQVYGFGGFGSISDPTLTVAEAAQKSKIFDWDKQEFIDTTPNDSALENSLINFVTSVFNPLVLATYDSDTETIDPITGAKVKHKKGDYKVNEDGDYYYETLGKRSPYGKQIKSIFDTLTVDGSSLNKYDFFDSDSLDKSVTGTLAKMTAEIVPLFTPIAPYYGYAMVGTAVMDLLPTLYNTVAGNFSDEDTTLPFFNQIQGISRSLKGNTSEYSKQNMFTFENFGNTIADVALQWQQQITIADLFKKINSKQINALNKNLAKEAKAKGIESTIRTGGQYENIEQNSLSAYKILSEAKLKPLLDAQNRMAANVSLGYMAGLQAFDVYEDTLQQGATKTEAALMAWGAALGMYKVDRTGLGELFFPELQSDAKVYRAAINTLRKDIQKGYQIAKGIKDNRNRLFKIMDSAREASSKYWQGVKEHSLGFFGKALGEGIEETSEELVVDFTKSTFNMLQDLGLTVSKDKMDAWDNMGERYLMNFFGGAIGGAIFYGVDTIQGRNNRSDSEKQELTYLLRNGKKSDLIKELGNLESKGKLGSTVLSGTKTEQSGDTINWITATDSNDSQNHLIAKQIRDVIESVDKALYQEGLNLSDANVLDQIILADQRLSKIQETVGITGTESRLIMDFNKLSQQIADKVIEINNYKKQYTDISKSKERSENNNKTSAYDEYQEGLNKLQNELSELRKKREYFFSEEASAKYVKKLLFEIDDSVNFPFYQANFSQYIKAKTGKNKEELTVEQIEKLQEAFIKYKEATKYDKFDEAFELYEHFNDKFPNHVNDNGNSYREFAKLRKFIWDELIDQERTLLRYNASKKANLEDLENMFLNGVLDLDPVLKIDYDPEQYNPALYETPELLLSAEEYNKFQELTPEEQAIRRAELDIENENKYQEAVKNKAAKIQEIVDKFKQIGFIDTQTKNLLIKVIGTSKIKNTLENSKSDNIIFLNSNLDNSLRQFVEDIIENDDTNTDLQDIEDIGIRLSYDYNYLINRIKEILKEVDGNNDDLIQERVEKILDNFLQDLINLDVLRDPIDNEITDLEIFRDIKENFMQSLKGFFDLAKNSENYKLQQLVKNELSTIKDNPLYTFLKEVQTEASGKESNVFDILQELNSQLQKVNVSEFVLDSIQVQEIDSALKALDIVESLINAASTEKLSISKLFGHNAVYNDFISNLSGMQKLGTVDSDLATMMLQDVQLLRQQLQIIKRVSDLNTANSLNAQKKTGQNLNRLLANVLKDPNLLKIEINGIKLFDISDIDTPTLNKLIKGEDVNESGKIELDNLEQRVANNFIKIKKTTGWSDSKLAKEIIEKLLSIYKVEDIALNKSTIIDQNTEVLNSCDAINYILAVITLPKKEFNKLYKEVLPKYNKVPLPAQEHLLYLGTAYAKGIIFFNELVNQLPEQIKKVYLHKLKNIFCVNGIGGSGKTTMLAILNELQSKYINSNRTDTYVLAPHKTQVENANEIINGQKQLTIEEFIKEILDEETYNQYNKYVQDHENSDLFEFDKNTQLTKLKKDLSSIKFKNIDKIKNIIIDEYTHIDIATALILSALGQKHNIVVNFSGDSFQNGYFFDNDNQHLENCNRFNAFLITAPKLSVSMRSLTIQKKKNEKTLVAASEIVDVQLTDESERKIEEDLSILFKEYPFLYYEGEDEPLSGEKFVQFLQESKIRELINTNKKIIYVYDDKIDPVISKLNSELDGKIETFKTSEVQGLEADYVIVDVDFSKQENVMRQIRNLYTLLTRSIMGTLVVDRNLTKIFPDIKSIPTDYSVKGFDPEKLAEKLKELSEKRQEELAISIDQLEDYSEEPEQIEPEKQVTADEEGVNSKILSLITKITNANVAQHIKDSLNKQVNDIKESITRDSDFGDLLEKLRNIEIELDKYIKEANNLEKTLKEILSRIKIVRNWLNSTDGKNWLGSQYDALEKQFKQFEDSMNEHLNNHTIFDDSELDILTELEKYQTEYLNNLYKTKKDNVLNDNEPEEKDPIKNDVEIVGKTNKRTIRTYGFYTRIGDLEQFNLLEKYKQDFIKTFLQIKSALLYNEPKQAREVIREIFNKIKTNEYLNDSSDENKNRRAILSSLIKSLPTNKTPLSGEFKILLKNKFDNSDNPIVPIQNFDLNKIIGTLIYEFKDDNNNIHRITLGAIADPKIWLDNDPSNKVVREYANFINITREKLSNSNPEIAIKVELNQPSRFTNLQRLDEWYNLSEFRRLNPNTIISDIFVCGKATNDIEKRYAGKPIVFVTNDHYYRDASNKLQPITPDILPDLYRANKDNNATGAQVRKIILDYEGQWVTNTTQIGGIKHGFFDLQTDLFKRLSSKDLGKFLDSQASNMTGVNMFITLWNWRAELLTLQQNYSEDAYSKRTISGNNGVVQIPKSLDRYVAIGKGNKVLVKNKEVLDTWIELLDRIIKVIQPIFNSDLGEETDIISGTRKSNLLTDLSSSAAGSITVKVGESSKQLDISRGNKVVTLLSATYQDLIRNGYKLYGGDLGLELVKVDADTNEEWLIEAITEFKASVNRISQSEINLMKDVDPETHIELFTSLFNIMFHGKRYLGPEKFEQNSLRNNKFVLFPYGVFFHAKLQSAKDEFNDKEWYPLYELMDESQFKLNVLVQDPNITFNLELQEVKDVKIPESKFNKDSLPSSIQTFIKDFNIDDKTKESIKKAWDESFKEREKNIYETLMENDSEELFKTTRNPDKYLLYIFRGKLAEILSYKATLFKMIKTKGTDAPIRISINTSDDDITIEVSETLKRIIGEQSTSEVGGYIKYMEDGKDKLFYIKDNGVIDHKSKKDISIIQFDETNIEYENKTPYKLLVDKMLKGLKSPNTFLSDLDLPQKVNEIIEELKNSNNLEYIFKKVFGNNFTVSEGIKETAKLLYDYFTEYRRSGGKLKKQSKEFVQTIVDIANDNYSNSCLI